MVVLAEMVSDNHNEPFGACVSAGQQQRGTSVLSNRHLRACLSARDGAPRPDLLASPEPSLLCTTASVGGLILGPHLLADYCASKHAAVALTESLVGHRIHNWQL